MAGTFLDPLFQPRAVAVVGASPKGGYGLMTLQNLRSIGYAGAVYPINPRYAEIDGLPCFPSLADVPTLPDAVAIAVPAAAAIDVTRQAGALGIPTGVVYAAGFAETGEEGQALQNELLAVCRESRMLMVGPNCLGVVNYVDRCALWGITMGQVGKPGAVALIGQSGNMTLNLMMARRGVRLSHAVSYGNGMNVGAEDLLEHFSTEPAVRVVALIVESLRDVQRFISAADRARSAGKHVVALDIGRTEKGQAAAAAHTGAMTSARRLFGALCASAGVARCDDLEEFVETCKLLASGRVPRGTRIGVFASSGGECGHVSDLAAELGLELPAISPEIAASIQPYVPTPVPPGNPLDITAMGWAQRAVYRLAAEGLAGTADVDAVLCIGDAPAGAVPLAEMGWLPMAQGLGDAVRATDKPVINVNSLSDVGENLIDLLEGEGVVPLVGLRPAMRAVLHAATLSRHCRRRPDEGYPLAIPGLIDTLTPGQLSEGDAKRLLSLCGVPIPDGGEAATPEDAASLAERIGAPVVLKADVPGLTHKTEVGGVVVGLTSPSDVAREAYLMCERLSSAGISSPIAFRVERMERGLAELIVGGGYDPVYGRYVMAGFGGVTAEVLNDVAHRLAPVTVDEALAMLQSLRLYPLLTGFRGAPPADIHAAAHAISRISQLIAVLPIAELDVNPLLVSETGCVALDALVVVREVPLPPRAHVRSLH